MKSRKPRIEQFDGAIRMQARAGKPASSIAKFCGVAPQTLTEYCKKKSIKVIDGRGRPKSTVHTTRDRELCELFKTGKTLQQVGDVYGITRERVRQILVKNGIDERFLWAFHNSGLGEKARELYRNGESAEVMAAELGYSYQSILTGFERDADLCQERRINQFWRNVAVTANPDKCWNWLGSVGSGGHGHTSWNGKYRGAHVIAYIIVNGTNPPKWVLHKCDNPPCCNPRHLYAGTPQDNVRDRDSRGRAAHQRGRIGAKLFLEDVEWIRSLLKAGIAQTKIAETVGVTFSTVNQIHTGKLWANPRGIQKLHKDEIRHIHEGLQTGSFTLAYVSRRFGVHPTTVSSIKRGTNWRIKKILSESALVA